MQALIEQLLKLKEQRYVALGNPNPNAAASYAVSDILNSYKTQAAYIEELLSEEIEDAQKALSAALPN